MKVLSLVTLILALIVIPVDRSKIRLPVRRRPNGSTPHTGRRLALVIGNGAYQIGPLKNPTNDADSMKVALTKSGFDVRVGLNLSLREMKDSVESFVEELHQGDVALFYFAGHGAQVDGHNYLIPVGAQISAEADVPYEAVDAHWVLDRFLEVQPSVTMLFLDACRDNPFLQSSRGLVQGLTYMHAPPGAIVAYATAAGAVASDGKGANGLYTKELLRQMGVKGVPIETMFIALRRAVHDSSSGAQTPWEEDALFDEFYFYPPKDVTPQPSRSYRSDTLAITSDINAVYATGVGRFKFGASPAVVNAMLPLPFASVEWNSLPIAGEYKSNEVRYFWVPLSRFSGRGLPDAELYAACSVGQSNVVFLFDQRGLFRISLRFYPDCPTGEQTVRRFANQYALPAEQGDSTSLFRYDGDQLTLIGVLDSRASTWAHAAVEWVRRDAPKFDGQPW